MAPTQNFYNSLNILAYTRLISYVTGIYNHGASSNIIIIIIVGSNSSTVSVGILVLYKFFGGVDVDRQYVL